MLTLSSPLIFEFMLMAKWLSVTECACPSFFFFPFFFKLYFIGQRQNINKGSHFESCSNIFVNIISKSMNTENILMLNRQKKYELYNMTPLTTGVASYI